jgi:hypothetical protein
MQKSGTGRLLALALFCVIAFGSAVAQAGGDAQPTRAQVMQLMSAMGVQQAIDNSLQDAQRELKKAARESFQKQNPETDEAMLKRLDQVFDSTPGVSFNDVADAIVPVYQRNLSAGDVQAGIDFYSSPAGKRLLEKVPQILSQANEEGGKLVQAKMEAYSDALTSKLETFQAEANAKKPENTQSADKPKAGDKSK